MNAFEFEWIFHLDVLSLEVETTEAVALFDYVGRTDKELSFKKNQTILIFKKMNHEWWQGCLAGTNDLGYVPDGYIKMKTKSFQIERFSTVQLTFFFVLDDVILLQFNVYHR